jgi:hypothetical protein
MSAFWLERIFRKISALGDKIDRLKPPPARVATVILEFSSPQDLPPTQASPPAERG